MGIYNSSMGRDQWFFLSLKWDKREKMITFTNEHIPWQGLKDFEEISISLDKIESVHKRLNKDLNKLANDIAQCFKAISNPIDEICLVTCPSCRDVCCKKATVFFDFKDLLYLHFGKRGLPSSQVSRNKEGKCCYLSISGCRLHRLERPFICTWYFCPDQTGFRREKQAGLEDDVKALVTQIKTLRNEMEDQFIQVVG